jgi:hypothetical protein
MADWFDQAMQGAPAVQQVATAPDGVPVYSDGNGQYYTQNGDGSYTQQFQGGLPDWLSQAVGGGQSSAPTDPLRAQIAQWAAMPGADPSLANDPNYWVNAINSRGGLTDANRQYWQNASVGPSAFFNNPNREGGGGSSSLASLGGGSGGVAGQQFQQAPQMPSMPAPAPFTGNTNYNPTGINAPSPLQAQQVSPQSVAQPGQVTPQPISVGNINAPAPLQAGTINAQGMAAPGSITPQMIQGTSVSAPSALNAQTLANPAGFQGVSKADLEADPGYQYRLQQAQDAITNSAAAQGIARGSNAWKALMQQASDMASQQYQQTYANKFGEWQAGINNTLNTTAANNAALAQAYGLTNQFGQNAALANQANALNVGQFNAGQAYNAQAQNIANQMQAGQFNAGLNYNQQAQNIANALQAGQFNAGMNYNTQAQNIANQMQAGQFNSSQNYNAQLANIMNTLGVNQFNAQQILQAQLANQGANLQAGQFNAGMDYNTQALNEANRFAASQANNANALNAYNASHNAALGTYQANVQNALGLGQLGLGYQQAANAYGLGLGQLGLGYANFGLNQQGQNYNQGLSTFNANQGAQQQLFNNNYSLAQLGLAANGQIGNFGQNYANQAGNLYTGIGNAQGAGSIANGNNWANALGQAGTYGLIGMYGGLGQQPQQQTWSPNSNGAGAVQSPYFAY